MNSDAPLRGGYTSTGIWLPTSALEAKADRSVTGVAPQGPSFRNAGVLEGRMNADNRFRDLSSYISAIKRVPWVWACVSVIAYNFANNGYQLLDAEGAEIEDPYDPFLRLWVRPNKRQTGFHFRELFMHYMQLAGEAFITLEEWDGNDQPHEMYLPNPARMRIQQDPSTGDVLRYWYDATGSNFATQQGFRGMVPYEPHEVIHVKYANPLDELRGLGAVEAMEDTLNIVAEMTGTELSYWKSGGRITGVLQTEQQVDDLTFDKLVQRWRDFTTGSGRDRSRFKTAILEQGLKYQPIAEGLRGLDLTKMEDSKRDVVLANFGVPLQKLAIFNAATGYKSDDADRFFYGETMEPIFTRVEDGGAQPLVEIFNPDRIFRFDRRNYEDDTVKLNNAKVMQGLLYTFGEISTYLGVDPPDDVRKDMVLPPAGATPVTLDQLKNLGQDPVQHPLQPPPKPTPTPPRPPGQVPLAGTQPSATNTENGRSGAVDANGHLPNRATTAIKALGLDPDTMDPETVKHLRPAEKQALRAHYDAELAKAHAVARTHRRPTEAKGLARLNYVTKAAHRAIGGASPRRGTAALGAGEHIRRAIAAIRTRLTPKHAARIKDAFDTQRRRLTSVLKDAPEAFRRLQTAEQRQAWLRDRWPSEPLAEAITGLHVEAANDGWRMAKRSLGFTLGKDAPGFETKEGPTGTEEWVSTTLEGRYGKLPEDRITGVDDTTIARVEEMVSEGVRRSYSALQIANGNPDENYDGVTTLFEDDYRAEEIARTEAMFAANWGSTTSLLDSGVQQVEGMDGHDDPECAERDGKLFDLDPDTGHAVDDDGEPVVDHPNGTLAFAPRIDTSVVPTGALDGEGDGAAGEVTASEEEAEAEWETKVGTGQNNNPQGVNQTSHRGGGRRKGPTTHTHANGVTHTHAGGHLPHAHSAGAHASGSKPTATQGMWDANVAAKREAPESEQKHGTGQTNNADGANQTGSHPDAKKREHRHSNGVVHSHVGGARPHTHDKGAEDGEGKAPLWESPSTPPTSSKGDVAGHEFHGNQWSGGSGPGGVAATPAEHAAAAAHHLEKEVQFRAAAARLRGVDHEYARAAERSADIHKQHWETHVAQLPAREQAAARDARGRAMERLSARPRMAAGVEEMEVKMFHPVLGWGIKKGDFFTDEEGVVHPIRSGGDYSPELAGERTKTEPAPKESEAVTRFKADAARFNSRPEYAKLAAILQKGYTRTRAEQAAKLYLALRATASASHEEIVRALANGMGQRGVAGVENALVTRVTYGGGTVPTEDRLTPEQHAQYVSDAEEGRAAIMARAADLPGHVTDPSTAPGWVQASLGRVSDLAQRDGGLLLRPDGSVHALYAEHLAAITAVGEAVQSRAEAILVERGIPNSEEAARVASEASNAYAAAASAYFASGEQGTRDPALLDKLDAAKEAANSAATAAIEANNARQAVYFQALSEVRPLAAAGSLRVGMSTSKGALANVQKAAAYYPKDWMNAANERTAARVQANNTRANVSGNRIATETGDYKSAQSTAVHELGHYMENFASPRIRASEWAFYQARTAGESLRSLSSVTGVSGYRSGEVTRTDSFADPYMGKSYTGSTHQSNYELLTMGMEHLYGNSSPKTDAGYRAWLLGTLATA